MLQVKEQKPIDNILGHKFKVLDHGFIRVIDYMGDDSAIVQAARVSYGKGTKQVSKDRGLIRYLMRQHHSSPFEMNELKIHVKLPIFVARQWIRHRTANVNECSARYSLVPEEFYIPPLQEIASQSTDNKQGRGTPLSKEKAEHFQRLIQEVSQIAYKDYKEMTHPDNDVAREIARIILPVNQYTEMYWKIDLKNLLHFIALRDDSHAQKEIRQYAHILAEIVRVWCPLTFEAFQDYIVKGASFSKQQLEVIKELISNNHNRLIDTLKERTTMSNREWSEMLQKLNMSDKT